MNSILLSYLVGSFYTRIVWRYASDKTKTMRHYMYKKRFIPFEESHIHIKELLLSDRPCMVCRYGLTEAQIIGKYFAKKSGLLKNYGETGEWLYNTAGFFSKDGRREMEDIDKFAELMIEDSKQVDLIGASGVLYEDYVINRCCPQAEITHFDNLRIMVRDDSWGAALEGKKVLVIHPFAETIESQYNKRELIWKNPSILPSFKLKTYKAVQTVAGNDVDKYDDWFSALEFMKKEIHNIDFDIALIGCGAYGFPLAAEIKRMGRKAVHLGGQTQMCFGILGKRWEEIPYYKQFINEAWVHPSEKEKPVNFAKVEGGCYW